MTAPISNPIRICLTALMFSLLIGCQTLENIDAKSPANPASAPVEGSAQTPQKPQPTVSQPPAPTPTPSPTPPADLKQEKSKIYKGSGVLLKPQSPEIKPAGGDINLNFEGADIRDIAKTVLAEILRESYIVDPRVQGSISFRTTTPLPKDALLPTLETILRMNGIVMVKENGIFKIMPLATVKGSLSPRMAGPYAGYSIQIVPLKYAGAREMAKILEAIAPDPAAVKTDELRNLLIVAGTQNEIRHMLDTVELFDVDWLSGMSFGLFILQNADVKSVDKEMRKLLDDKAINPLAGAVRIIPIERLNGFVIITAQPHYLDQAKLWLERLDQGGGSGGPKLYVYHVQNGKAEHLAELINQMFSDGKAGTRQAAPAASVAPGLTGTQVGSPFGATGGITAGGLGGGATSGMNLVPKVAAAAALTGATLAISDGDSVATNIRVVADRENNALLILANAAGYEKIEAALKKLDFAPRQVLIEVTIAEVTLKDELSYGVEWLFTNGARRGGKLDTGSEGLNAIIPGFSYAFAAASGDIRGILNMLASDNKLSILSSPHIMVSDNQMAKIQVGDSVPIQGNQTVVGTNVVNSTQYVDTGIILSVIPRINSSGLVNMEILQEVSTPSSTTSSGLNSPTISKRSAKTNVAVQSGDTMVMGGLISEISDKGSVGVPVLSSIPILGGLFGTQTLNKRRTELLLVLTPRVANNISNTKSITEEMQKKMGLTKDLLGCGTSNVFGLSSRGGLWCLQPGRFDGPIDKIDVIDPATGRPAYPPPAELKSEK